ncbi:protein-ADP-ribose hydrolase [Streptococcus suis]|uniref:protein-ADP-ribose hydrolase n=1 Tax=Streptococcus suis TaxID=1307 RepID=UPI0023D888F2|nr:protein-ADP-ribose hydrolase [Streptococcus suis]
MPKNEMLGLLTTMIAILQAEKGESQSAELGLPSLEEALPIWRALINQRPAGAIGADYLTAEAAFLAAYHEEHMQDVSVCQPTSDPRIFLYQGDLCHLQVDAVVNAANSQMLGCFIPNHACLDNALHTFAGLDLRLFCAKKMEEQGLPAAVGKVMVTPGFHLPAGLLFHTVGPFIPEGKPVSAIRRGLLEQCYLSCLEEAKARGLNAIAFPTLSTGEFGYPKDQAAEVAVRTVRKWLAETAYPLKVIFSTYTVEDQGYYTALLGEKEGVHVADA